MAAEHLHTSIYESRRGCGLGLAHLQEAGLPLPAGEVLQLVGQQCSLQVCDGRLADRLAAVTAHPSHPLRGWKVGRGVESHPI